MEAIDSKVSLAILIICLHYVLYCTLCGICLPRLLALRGNDRIASSSTLSVALVMIDSTQYVINFIIYTAACKQYRQVR